MGDDDGTTVMFDEVCMQDMIDDWSRQYAEGVSVGTWYYDCRTQTVLIRLTMKSEEESRCER